MPTIRMHGGGCCGVRHYVGFGQHNMPWGANNAPTEEQVKEGVRGYGDPAGGGRTKGKCIEAVITDTQFRANPDLAQWLKDAGFRIVDRFHNSTGGMCNVLHRTSGRRRIDRGRLPSWVVTLREDA